MKKRNLSLTEILLVVLIVAVLAVIVFISINPMKRLGDSRDLRRSTDVESILSAVHSYIADNKGALPIGLTTNMAAQVQIGTIGGAAISTTMTSCTVAANAKVDLTTPLAKYLKTMPADPKDGTSAATGYVIQVDANNVVTVSACNSENASITASR